MQSKTITSFWWVDHIFNILSFTSTKQKKWQAITRGVLQEANYTKKYGYFIYLFIYFGKPRHDETNFSETSKQARLPGVKWRIKREFSFFLPRHNSQTGAFFFSLLLLFKYDITFLSRGFLSLLVGGHTEQQIECPFNINSGLELKNISSNVPF